MISEPEVICVCTTVLTLALVGCSTNKIKVAEVKPNPLPKLEQAQSLVPVFSQSVASTTADPLRLQLDAENGVIYTVDPKGEMAAYQGKQRLWQKQVSKQGLTAGVNVLAMHCGCRKCQVNCLL